MAELRPTALSVEKPQQWEPPHLNMMQWYATDRGTRCPICGRFAKEADLGAFVALEVLDGNGNVIQQYTALGHLDPAKCRRITAGEE